MTKRIQIFLPKDRAKPGFLHVFDEDGRSLLANVECLGKADNGMARREGNARRDPTLPYGDAPSGRFAPTRLSLFVRKHRRMGIGWIPLDGDDGQALEAKDNGRYGLGIHAGRGDERLVPTYGCIRVTDRDFDRLVQKISVRPVIVTVEDIPASHEE